MRTVRGMINFSMLRRKFIKGIEYLPLLVALSVLIIPETGFARVLAAFGPEDFIRSTGKPTTEVREFQVRNPDASEFTLHLFYAGIKKDLKGVVPSALIKLNGMPIVTPDEFSRNIHYIRKPVTLSKDNTLSLDLRGKPGSGISIVITGLNDDPRVFDFNQSVQPDGSNLFGPNLKYFWTIVDEPEFGSAWLSDPYSPTPSFHVDLPGEYTLQLSIQGDSWATEPIINNLSATCSLNSYAYVPVPVKTRVVTGTGTQYSDYSIQVGQDMYTAQQPRELDPPDCDSATISGFQVIVLDRYQDCNYDCTILEPKYHRCFNVPSGNTEMVNFLDSLEDSDLVIVSSLNNVYPRDVCGNSPSCPLGAKLMEFGATNIFSSNYSSTLSYYLPKMTTPTNFSYSLIGIKGLGQNEGYELNNWDHKALTLNESEFEKIYSNIEGFFVQDVHYNGTFVYPEFIEIETRSQPSLMSNTIRVGETPYYSRPLLIGAEGGFQVLILDQETLEPAAFLDPSVNNMTFSTNCGMGADSFSEQEQERMFYYFADMHLYMGNSHKLIVVISSIGTPIGYKSIYYMDLAKIIWQMCGGSLGAFNQLGELSSTYSLVGMIDLDNGPYFFGANDTVEASASGVNLRVAMHKDKQGWYLPIITNPGAEGETGGPDLSLLSEALKPYTPWPLYDPTLDFDSTDPLKQQLKAAYEYISSHLGEGTLEYPVTDIRSRYVGSDASWKDYCLYPELVYANIPDTEKSKFSEDVYTQMWEQLCGEYGEFNYVKSIASFSDDLDYVLTKMQISSETNLGDVYDAVQPVVGVEDGHKILYNAAIVTRGVLTAATAIVPNPALKGIMGTVNCIMLVALGVSKDDGGKDYTSLDTAYLSLKTEMNSLWSNLPKGKDKLIGIIMSDWGKLKYVAEKLTTDPQYGGWRYFQEDRDDWVDQITDTLEAYYFQSLIPAVWKIDYMAGTTEIPHPKNFSYYAGTCWDPCCSPYCGGASENANAFWVDQFPYYEPDPYIYTWFVLEDEIDMGHMSGCGFVHFDRSADLRDVLFGEGPWEGGQKLNLEPYVFYERWLPSGVYTPYVAPTWPYDPDPYYSDCD